MNCEQVRQLLNGYIDDELDLATALRMEEHLPGCADCRMRLEAAQAVRHAAAQSAVYHPAPPALRDRLRQAIQAEAAAQPPSSLRFSLPWWKRPMAYSGLAASIIILAGLAVLLFPPRAPRGEIDEVVASHLRSLEANHLVDVQSTDQHTVKPWFTGKIDFSPPVIDLASKGFPLIGGRLDYLEHQKVAALVYMRHKHVINLFIWPGEATPLSETKQGFNLIRFQCKGMACWAISDVNAAELQQFVDLFQAQ
jgi:anti-sigma factor RsiW